MGASLTEKATVSGAQLRKLLFVALLGQNHRLSRQRFQSATISALEGKRTLCQGSKESQLPIPAAETIAAWSMLTPYMEEKLRCVKCGPLTNSCPQAIVDVTTSAGIATRSRLMKKGQNGLLGTCTTRAVN